MDWEGVRTMLLAHIKKYFKTQKVFAIANCCSPAYINAVLKGSKPIPKWMLDLIGVTATKVTIYNKKDK